MEANYDAVLTHLSINAVSQDPAARKYAEWTGRACEADGIRYELRTVTEYDLEEQLYLANEDPEVHGIMTFFPVFGTCSAPEACTTSPLVKHTNLGHWINCRSPLSRLLPFLLRRQHGRLPPR